MRSASVRSVSTRVASWRSAPLRCAPLRFAPEVRADIGVLIAQLVPGSHALLEHREVLVVRYGSTRRPSSSKFPAITSSSIGSTATTSLIQPTRFNCSFIYRIKLVGCRISDLCRFAPVRNLLIFAKHLFVAAMSWWQLPLRSGPLVPSCRRRMKAANERPNDKLLSHGLQKR